jgi:Domain of unknown function (DUF4340)
VKPRTTLILVVIGALVLAGGWYVQAMRQPDQQPTTERLVFPDLASHLQNASRIEIVHQGKTTTIIRSGERWGLEDRGGYPVQSDKIREMLTGFTELRLVEPRTADPSQLARLGVEDPNDPHGSSSLVRVLDASGRPIVELITGHRRVRPQGQVPESVYVRRPGENQAWLAEGRLPVDADPQLWLNRDVMNIDHSRIASVTVTRGGEKLDFAMEDGKLVLKSPSDHPKLDYYKLDELERGLELLTFQDVKPVGTLKGEAEGESVFVTKDGLSVTVSAFHEGSDFWARFAASGTGEVKGEADGLQAKLGDWAYQLGSWKEKAVVPAIGDLKATEAAPAEAPKQ